jgi:hypothetical protein
MGTNPELRCETGSIPLRANGAFVAKRAVVASTDGSNGEQRGAPAAAVGQHATLATVPKFIGVSPEACATGLIGEVVVKGRTRAVGGGVITAGDYVTYDANAKFTSYSHDATKFGNVAGIAASDCSGDDAEFDLFLAPMLIGPASATTDNFTLSATLTAADVVTTDDVTVGDDLVVTGLATIGETLAVTGNITAGARVLGKQGTDVASATNLTLPSDGNVFEVTGTTKIDLISNIGWQNGSEVTLFFTSTANVDHGTATSTTNITIKLDGGVDFVPAAGDMLKLMLAEVGGTQVWRETGRVVYA